MKILQAGFIKEFLFQSPSAVHTGSLCCCHALPRHLDKYIFKSAHICNLVKLFF